MRLSRIATELWKAYKTGAGDLLKRQSPTTAPEFSAMFMAVDRTKSRIVYVLTDLRREKSGNECEVLTVRAGMSGGIPRRPAGAGLCHESRSSRVFSQGL